MLGRRHSAMLVVALVLGTIAAAAAGAAAGDSSSSGPRRALLQNQQYVWPREMASISAARDLVQNLVASGAQPADSLRAGARAAELVRLASNKAVQPVDFDRPSAPAPASGRTRLAAGRRRLQQQQALERTQQPATAQLVPLDAVAEALAENML